MKKKIVKIISVILIMMLLLNMVLFALGKIKDLLFWIIIGFGGLSSYMINRFLK